jgi:hypothetical protein
MLFVHNQNPASKRQSNTSKPICLRKCCQSIKGSSTLGSMQCQNLFTVEWESILFLEQKENHITFHKNSSNLYILYIDAKN